MTSFLFSINIFNKSASCRSVVPAGGLGRRCWVGPGWNSLKAGVRGFGRLNRNKCPILARSRSRSRLGEAAKRLECGSPLPLPSLPLSSLLSCGGATLCGAVRPWTPHAPLRRDPPQSGSGGEKVAGQLGTERDSGSPGPGSRVSGGGCGRGFGR